jgi:hypothetical protein
MTTKKQIKWLLDQLLTRNDDVVGVGPFVILKPLQHVIRTISIDRTSSADYPNFFWSIGHAFNPLASLQGICLESIFLARGAPRRWSEPGMAETFLETAEQRFLPMLRKVETISDMFRVEGEPRSCEYDLALGHRPYLIHFHAANGQFDAAIRVLDELVGRHRDTTSWRRREYDYAIDHLGPLIRAGDRIGAANMLHRWERNFVTRNRLEAIYESTPFPLEVESRP